MTLVNIAQLSFVPVLVLIVMAVAGLMAIDLFINLAREKGHKLDNSGMLWFVGIFASPIVLGLYVAALPDKRSGSSSDISRDLPSL